MKTKTMFLIVGLVLASLLLASCATATAPAVTQAPSQNLITQPPAQLVPVRVRLDWIPGPEHAAFYVAKELGYYQACGLDVTIDPGSGSSDSAKLLGTGEIQFGIVDGAELVTARSQGIPIVSMAVIYQDTPVSIIWLADSLNIKAPADLVGHTIGTNAASAHDIVLEAFLKSQGLTGKVKIVPIGGEGMQPVLMGQVDTQMGFNVDSTLIEVGGKKPGYLLVKDYGVTLYGLTISTNETYLKDHPEYVKCFVQSSLKAFDYLISNPNESMEIERKYVAELDPPELGLKKLNMVFPLIKTTATDANGIGWQDEAKWAATQQTLVDQAVFANPTDPAKMFSMLALQP